jgi:hypothetical protein
MKTIELALQEAAKPGFWGQIQIDYQNGEPVVMRKIETTNLKKAEEETRRHESQFRTK